LHSASRGGIVFRRNSGRAVPMKGEPSSDESYHRSVSGPAKTTRPTLPLVTVAMRCAELDGARGIPSRLSISSPDSSGSARYNEGRPRRSLRRDFLPMRWTRIMFCACAHSCQRPLNQLLAAKGALSDQPGHNEPGGRVPAADPSRCGQAYVPTGGRVNPVEAKRRGDLITAG